MLWIFGFAFVIFWIFTPPPRTWPLGLRSTPQRWSLTRTPQDSHTHDLLLASNSGLFACGLPNVGFPKSLAERQTWYFLFVARQRIWGLEIGNKCIILKIKMVSLKNRIENQHQWIFGILRDAFNRYSSWQIWYGFGVFGIRMVKLVVLINDTWHKMRK